MDRERIRSSILEHAEVDYARSGGPGGQNVNKVNSKAVARIRLDSVEGLSEREREQARARLASRLTQEGELVVAADDERDQPRNRALALARLAILVEKAALIMKTRKPTAPTHASRERRLSSKRSASTIKRGRGRPSGDD